MRCRISDKELFEELRERLLDDDELRKAFISSIESSLNEAKPYTKERDLAEAIMNRLIG